MSLNQATPYDVNVHSDGFVDRRNQNQPSGQSPTGHERRQFSSSYNELTAEGAELGEAVDAYKLSHRRRFVTYDEILDVVKSLGYQRPDPLS